MDKNVTLPDFLNNVVLKRGKSPISKEFLKLKTRVRESLATPHKNFSTHEKDCLTHNSQKVFCI